MPEFDHPIRVAVMIASFSLAALAVAILIAMHVHGTKFGTFGDWLSGVGTLATAGVTVYLLSREQEDRAAARGDREARAGRSAGPSAAS